MNYKAMMIAIAIGCAFMSLPAALAQIPNAGVGDCVQRQTVHTFELTGVLGVADGQKGQVQEDSSGGFEQPFDTCTQTTVDTSVAGLTGCVTPGSVDTNTGSVTIFCVTSGDGDPDSGFGGGSLPSGTCIPGDGSFGNPVSHHASANNTAVYANNLAGIAVAWTAGTDGAVTGCIGNGVVSNDPDTDPQDCGSGNVGVWGSASESAGLFSFDAPAHIQTNGGSLLTPGFADPACNPAGGAVAVFLQVGPVVNDDPHCTLPNTGTLHLGLLSNFPPTGPGDLIIPPQPGGSPDLGDQSGCGNDGAVLSVPISGQIFE